MARRVNARESNKRRRWGATGYLSVATVSVALLLALAGALVPGDLVRSKWAPSYAYAAWLAAWSVVTFAMYLFDKRAARRGNDRVNESVLHLLALLGGFVGGWIGRHGLRHKTQKPVFAVILAVATVLHLGLAGATTLGLW